MTQRNDSCPSLQSHRVRTWGPLVLGLLLGGLCPDPLHAQPRYGVTDLGVLAGNASSFATSLNDRGEVVGYSSPAVENFNETAFVWSRGVLRDLGKLPKGLYSFATSINSLGVVVGDGDTGNSRPQSWVTTGGGLFNFFPNSGGNTHAIGINDAGAICGYYTKSLSGWVSSWKPVIWAPDVKDPRKYRTILLPVLLGADPTFKGTTAIPAAFNQAGQAAGYAANEVIGQHACFWQNDAAHTIVDLGVFPGDWSSIAWGINGRGQVVGESHPAFGSRPVAWDNAAAPSARELPLLPGDNYGIAMRINDVGQILGSSAASEPGTWNVGPARWVIWTHGGVFALNDLLETVSGAGWNITAVAGINNLGQIAATAIRQGQTRAILLTPVVR